MQYFEADTPENVLFNVTTVNSLDRNAITTDNCIKLLFGEYSIYPLLDLHPSPTTSTDSEGNDLPEWLKGLAVGLGIAGAILVAGAITVLTAGAGWAFMATTMVGAALHGAAIGTLIGAGVGIVGGALLVIM